VAKTLVWNIPCCFLKLYFNPFLKLLELVVDHRSSSIHDSFSSPVKDPQIDLQNDEFSYLNSIGKGSMFDRKIECTKNNLTLQLELKIEKSKLKIINAKSNKKMKSTKST
jgi:hypothetical protein